MSPAHRKRKSTPKKDTSKSRPRIAHTLDEDSPRAPSELAELLSGKHPNRKAIASAIAQTAVANIHTVDEMVNAWKKISDSVASDPETELFLNLGVNKPIVEHTVKKLLEQKELLERIVDTQVTWTFDIQLKETPSPAPDALLVESEATLREGPLPRKERDIDPRGAKAETTTPQRPVARSGGVRSVQGFLVTPVQEAFNELASNIGTSANKLASAVITEYVLRNVSPRRARQLEAAIEEHAEDTAKRLVRKGQQKKKNERERLTKLVRSPKPLAR